MKASVVSKSGAAGAEVSVRGRVSCVFEVSKRAPTSEPAPPQVTIATHSDRL